MSGASDDDLVVRGGPVLRPDASRTLLRPFVPGQELVSLGVSRAEAVVRRVLELPSDEVQPALDRLVEMLSPRHDDPVQAFRDHAALVAAWLPSHDGVSSTRLDLLGAYLTQEYAVEAAAILNPSIVPHPDQGGLGAGELRVVLSLRGIGEGHISSLEFRSGVVTHTGEVTLDQPGPRLVRAETSPRPLPVEYLRQAAEALGSGNGWLLALSDRSGEVTPEELNEMVHGPEPHPALSGLRADWLHTVSDSCYRAEFPAHSELGARVLFPSSAAERHGIEDARLLRCESDDEPVTYLGTYTAYDGQTIAPHLLKTSDFLTFEVTRLLGPAARDKGMALFPRAIGGLFRSIARRDRETLILGSSADGTWWEEDQVIESPVRPWELIQLGSCAPPIETEQGWLVITHAVGPVRHYALSALLLDLKDPTRVRGQLNEPLLVPNEDERIGYVPNVVYSCGALVHEGTLVLPYGCSDSAVRFARVDVEALLRRLRQSGL